MSIEEVEKLKKRCTNSKCRRIFSYMTGSIAVCPYCKKTYPRSINQNYITCIIGDKKYPFKRLWKAEKIFLFIMSDYKKGNLKLIQHICEVTGLYLPEVRAITEYIAKYKKVPVKVNIIDRKIEIIQSVSVDVIPDIKKYYDEYEKKLKNIDNIKKMDIADLNLSIRSYMVLRRVNITTIGQLMKMKSSEVRSLRNMGRKSYEEVLKCLESLNIYLDDDE